MTDPEQQTGAAQPDAVAVRDGQEVAQVAAKPTGLVMQIILRRDLLTVCLKSKPMIYRSYLRRECRLRLVFMELQLCLVFWKPSDTYRGYLGPSWVSREGPSAGNNPRRAWSCLTSYSRG